MLRPSQSHNHDHWHDSMIITGMSDDIGGGASVYDIQVGLTLALAAMGLQKVGNLYLSRALQSGLRVQLRSDWLTDLQAAGRHGTVLSDGDSKKLSMLSTCFKFPSLRPME